eukprot:364557-Chlamydomonas_euryale.AAC.13
MVTWEPQMQAEMYRGITCPGIGLGFCLGSCFVRFRCNRCEACYATRCKRAVKDLPLQSCPDQAKCVCLHYVRGKLEESMCAGSDNQQAAPPSDATECKHCILRNNN